MKSLAVPRACFGVDCGGFGFRYGDLCLNLNLNESGFVHMHMHMHMHAHTDEGLDGLGPLRINYMGQWWPPFYVNLERYIKFIVWLS